VSSYVKQITNSLEARILTLVPTFKKSPYVWSVEKNNAKTSNKIFRVIPDAAQSVDGTLRTLTISQKFTVFLTTNFANKNISDQSQQDETESLYAAIEILNLDAMKRHFAISRIMSVSGIEMTAPEIDQDNDTVTIGASYNVLYRME
jgi:hypothetical protein